jgi:hypothetical protein
MSGPGVDVRDDHTRRERLDPSYVGRRASRVNGNVDAASTQFGCKTGDVYVLASGVSAARLCRRTGVIRHESDGADHRYDRRRFADGGMRRLYARTLCHCTIAITGTNASETTSPVSDRLKRRPSRQ